LKGVQYYKWIVLKGVLIASIMNQIVDTVGSMQRLLNIHMLIIHADTI
jgi:hypothetical protein